MSKMTSTEMARIAFLLDTVPEWHGVEGVFFGQIPLFDDNGELLGHLDANEAVFEAS